MSESRFAEAFAKEPETVPIVESMGRLALAETPLLELIPKVSQEFAPPNHLAEWCGLIDRAAKGEAVRGMCAEPIRHYKSQTTMHGVIRILLADPTTPIIHLSHSFERAQAIGKRIRQLAKSCDEQWGTQIGPERGQDTIADWRNTAGGGVVVMSADQSKLGYDCGCLIADDPIDEHGALDAKVRDAVDEAISHYTARCMRKGKPGPVLLVMSRWHPDDPMGRRLLRTAREWTYVSHRAIDVDTQGVERAFAPDVWPLAELKAMREELAERDPTERIWWAQLQNDPRPVGSDMFRDPARYDTTPPWAFRVLKGCDFAFSQAATADFFAAVVLYLYGSRAYVKEARRERLDPHAIENVLRQFDATHGPAPWFSYQSGPEIGLTNVLIERGLRIQRMPARFNKLVRAERTIKRWNDGNIAVPKEAPWTKGFVQRVTMFRGHEHDQDDEVDAMVSACDGAWGGGVGCVPRTLGRPRV